MKFIAALSVVATVMLASAPAFACDPNAEEAVVGELFMSRAPLSDAEAEKVLTRLATEGQAIGDLIKAEKIDAACEKISALKDYLKTLPAK